MKRFRLMAVLLVVLGLVASACFQIRYLQFWPKALTEGQTAKIKINLFPLSLDPGTNGMVVLLIGLEDLDLREVSEFDKMGDWGGPLASSRHDPLEAHMLLGGVCQANGIDADDMEASYTDWFAYRSNTNVDTTALVADDLGTKFRINVKVDRTVGTADGSFGSVVLFTGVWVDDGDGTPEGGEVLCSGILTMSIPFIA